MKKISLVFTMALVMFIGNAFANENPAPSKKLTQQIAQMLKKDATVLDGQNTAAEVRLMVDSFGKIQVLSVKTTDKVLEKFLMERIHQNVVQRDSYELGIVYRVPIEVTDEM